MEKMFSIYIVLEGDCKVCVQVNEQEKNLFEHCMENGSKTNFVQLGDYKIKTLYVMMYSITEVKPKEPVDVKKEMDRIKKEWENEFTGNTGHMVTFGGTIIPSYKKV